jgi:hypothetical protein
MRDEDNVYHLNDLGQLEIEPIDNPDEAYTVRPQDFSEFEKEISILLKSMYNTN